jgi:hypothetical protein
MTTARRIAPFAKNGPTTLAKAGLCHHSGEHDDRDRRDRPVIRAMRPDAAIATSPIEATALVQIGV